MGAQGCCLGHGQVMEVCLWRAVFSSLSRVFGSQNLTTVNLKGVGESFKKHPNYESKGIKAHFNLDESGVLSLDRVRTGEPSHRLSLPFLKDTSVLWG